MRQVIAILALVCGCSASGPEAVMTAPVGGAVDTRTVPWPSDALLSDGKLSVAAPFPFDSSGDGQNLRDLARTLSELDGFGTTGSIYFPVSEDVVVEAGAKAVVVDLDDPAQRREFPLFYRKDTKQLVAVAPIGTALRENRAYGCWVTAGVKSLRPSGVMSDAIAGRGVYGQKSAYGKLAKLLSAEKVQPIAATAWTTQTLTAWSAKVISDLEGMTPKATLTRLFAGAAALEALFGGPVTTTRPGNPKSGGVLHDAVAFAVEGTFDTPHYLADTPGVLGLFDAALTVKSIDRVPFMLVLPVRAGGYAATPVVIFQHGINDDRKAVLEVANSLCRAGVAVLGIDELWHGSRLPLNEDLVNNLSGAMVPDGIGDPQTFGAAPYFFNLRGDQKQHVEALDPRYIRDNFRQATVDLMQLVRLARDGDWSAVASADAALSGLTLDGSKLTYVGESFGSVLGAQVLALDPLLGSAVLDVAGGGIIVDLVGTSAQFAQLLQPFVAGAFDLLVDVNSPVEAPLHAQMSLGLLQTVVEPGDGLALAPAGDPGKHVLFIEAYSDETVPNHATEALARAWNVVQVTLSKKSRPTRVVDFMKVAAPYTVTGGGGVRALVQLDPAAHPMITQQEGEQGYLPDFPPFVKRFPPIPVINPTEEVHALAVKWAESFRLTDTPTVIDP